MVQGDASAVRRRAWTRGNTKVEGECCQAWAGVERERVGFWLDLRASKSERSYRASSRWFYLVSYAAIYLQAHARVAAALQFLRSHAPEPRAFIFSTCKEQSKRTTMMPHDGKRMAHKEKTKKKDKKKRQPKSTEVGCPGASPDLRVKSGGAWRPAAKVAKTDAGPVATASEGCSIALFYAYASPQWTKAKRDDLLERIVAWGNRSNMGGRVRVACEGVNVTVSGTAACLRAFATFLIDFDEAVFVKAEFKYIDNMPADRHFKVRVVLCTQSCRSRKKQRSHVTHVSCPGC